MAFLLRNGVSVDGPFHSFFQLNPKVQCSGKTKLLQITSRTSLSTSPYSIIILPTCLSNYFFFQQHPLFFLICCVKPRGLGTSSSPSQCCRFPQGLFSRPLTSPSILSSTTHISESAVSFLSAALHYPPNTTSQKTSPPSISLGGAAGSSVQKQAQKRDTTKLPRPLDKDNWAEVKKCAGITYPGLFGQEQKENIWHSKFVMIKVTEQKYRKRGTKKLRQIL